MIRHCDTDLSGGQWDEVRPLVQAKTGRKARVSRREIVNTILYVARTGCQSRLLLHDFLDRSTFHLCYHRWAWNGVLDKRHGALRAQVRSVYGKSAQPSAAIVDSQSVKVSSKTGLILPAARLGRR